MEEEDDRPEVRDLLCRIKAELPALEALAAKCRSTWCEDLVSGDGSITACHQR